MALPECPLDPRRCHREHILARFGPGNGSTRRCPLAANHERADKKPSFSVNVGRLGQRMVWFCSQCEPYDLRMAMQGMGMRAECLGNWEKTRPADGTTYAQRRAHGADAATLLRAQKYDAIMELPSAITGKLREMCIQAISEADDVSADPWKLLPADDAEAFYALSDRTGIAGNYKYGLLRAFRKL